MIHEFNLIKAGWHYSCRNSGLLQTLIMQQSLQGLGACEHHCRRDKLFFQGILDTGPRVLGSASEDWNKHSLKHPVSAGARILVSNMCWITPVFEAAHMGHTNTIQALTKLEMI